MSNTDFSVTEEEVREACKAYNVYDAGEQELAMHAALSKVFSGRRAAAQAPAEPSSEIGWRAGVYGNSTPHLHVGDSAFEDWFQQQPFATRDGIKQISRNSYAAGMGDPLVAAAGAPVNTVAQDGSVAQDLTASAGQGADAAQELTKLRQALVYVAHALRPHHQMVPRGMCLLANNGVIVAINGWHLSVVEEGPVVPGKVYGWMIEQSLSQTGADLAGLTQTAPPIISELGSRRTQALCWLLELGPNAKDGDTRAAHIAAAGQAIAKDSAMFPAPSSTCKPATDVPGWMTYNSRVGAMISDENGVHVRVRQFSLTDMGLNRAFTMPHGTYDLYAYPAGQQPAQFSSETPAMTAAEHKVKLARVETLIALNPAVESPEGRELSQLAIEIERFETDVYGDLSSPQAEKEHRRLYIVMNEKGSQGVVFDHLADANWTLTGEGVGSGRIDYPTLGESFRECYPDGLTLHEVDAGIVATSADLKSVS